jgi:Ni,Fe-hydrogenase I large subunit
MAEEAYRVQVIHVSGAYTHGAQFSNIEDARDYYDSIDEGSGFLRPGGCRKELQRRPAGKSRYETIESSNIKELPAYWYQNEDEDGSPLDADNDPDS